MTSDDAPRRGNPYYEFDDGANIAVEWSVIDGFKKRYATEDLAKRMCTSIWVETIALDQRYGINVLNVLQPIFDLENGSNMSRTKLPTSFTGKILKGLWHKHYFSARFLPGNILAGLGGNGIQKILLDVMGGQIDETRRITKADVREIAQRVVTEPLNRREGTSTLTGEWIIYLPRPDGNYYLTLATHTTTDEEIFQRIETECPRDFPSIMDWINEARG